MPVIPSWPEAEVGSLRLNLGEIMQCHPGEAAVLLSQLHNVRESKHSGRGVKIELLLTHSSESCNKVCKGHMGDAYNRIRRPRIPTGLIW